MFKKILKKDMKRNKVITIVLFIFIFMAAMLAAGAAILGGELAGAMDGLIDSASAPHLAQMHAGELDQQEIDEFTAIHSDQITGQQTVELLNVEGAYLYLGKNEKSEADSVMENAFVKQNSDFDFLLDQNNEVIRIEDGQIAIPVYHLQQYGLEPGDTVTVVKGQFEMSFKIVSFARDSLMNPSLITSKRFLVSDQDWEILRENIGEVEYMIEFQVSDPGKTGELESAYQEADLPQVGAAMNDGLVKQIHALSDGITAAVIIFIALLLVTISALCLRFTLISSIEEDYREIGVMKGMGISARDIGRIYLTKYVALGGAASMLGSLAALAAGNLFTKNITLYMGNASGGIAKWILPFGAAGLVFAAIWLFCKAILQRVRKIPPVEAIRTGASGNGAKERSSLRIARSPVKNINILLGVREVCSKCRVYAILGFIYTLAAFLMILPLNILSTLESPQFISYMGVGSSDIRIDLQQNQNLDSGYKELAEYLEADGEAAAYASYVTGSFKTINADGEFENIKVESGDFNLFPLTYAEGNAPENEDEIALSAMNASEYGKAPGDTIVLVMDGKEKELTVCGIYQDVTNGGKTAKAVFPVEKEEAVWITMNIRLAEGVSAEEKMSEYAAQFPNLKITDIEDYVVQTLGNMIEQLRLVAVLGIALALSISVLITVMFFKMLITKDRSQIAIMRSIGFRIKDIRQQYTARALAVLLTGIILGTIACFTIGESLAGMIITGVSQLRFTANPLISYLLCPAALILAVGAAIWMSGSFINNTDQLRINEE